MKVAPGNVLILMDPRTESREGIAVVDRKRASAPMTGIVEQVGAEDYFGKPIWEVGDKVVVPEIGGASVEIEGKSYKIVHHCRILLGL